MTDNGMDADGCPSCRTEEKDRGWVQCQDDGEIHKPWTRVSLDLRRLPNGQVGAIFIDEFSKFPVIEMLKTISLPGVRAILEKVWAPKMNSTVKISLHCGVEMSNTT